MSDIWIDLPPSGSGSGPATDVTIVEGGNTLTVNPNGSINVEIVPTTSVVVKTVYGAVTSVASGVSTTIVTYTVPGGMTSYLGSIQVSGNNIAQFDVTVNSVQLARQRTYYGGNLNAEFDFSVNTLPGYLLNPGDVLLVTVTQFQTYLGEFEATVIYAQ